MLSKRCRNQARNSYTKDRIGTTTGFMYVGSGDASGFMEKPSSYIENTKDVRTLLKLPTSMNSTSSHNLAWSKAVEPT